MKYLIIIILFAVTSTSTAQNGATFWNKYSLMNPSLTANRFKHQSMTNYYSNDLGFTDFYSHYATNLESIHTGLGVSYLQNNTQINTVKNLLLNGAYQIPTAGDNVFSFGANLGLIFNDFRESYEEIINEGVDLGKQTLFQLDLGLSYITEDFIFGLGARNLNNPIITINDSTGFEFSRELTAQFEYKFAIGEHFHLLPRLAGSYFSDNFFLDGNIQLQFNEKYMIGVGYSTLEDISFQINWDAKKKFRMGYSIEMITLEGQANRLSHEAVVGFMFGGKK